VSCKIQDFASNALSELRFYAGLDLNWKTFDDRQVDLFAGITLHHLPGHTAGLCGMQINLQDSGTFFFISDHAHVQENYDGTPQGWLGE
jgi:glyoxylase-like metal-dependent hydrolase (beta-lactamase superfamily II)